MDSDGDYSTDENKRKRNLDKEEIFSKSKKMMRTPVKSQQKTDEKLDKLIELIQNLSAEMQQMRKEQKEYSKEMEILKEENRSLKLENENIKKENGEIKEDLKSLNIRLEYWEKEKKQNNVIISGLKIDTSDQYLLKGAMENFIKQHLDIEVPIRSATRLGQKTCLIVLEKMEDKVKVMENKSKLRKLENEKIYINNDLTIKERDIQKKIRKRAEEERKKGRKVKIGYQKLVIDGKQWRWNKRSDKLESSEETKQANYNQKN